MATELKGMNDGGVDFESIALLPCT